MTELWKVILFGIVEGITEWLPVSSTGHMILLNEFVKLRQSREFMDMFLVVIQLGAILAVVWLYWDKIFPFSMKGRLSLKKDTMSMWGKAIAACIPAAVAGLLWDDVIDRAFYNYFVVAVALIVFGVLFLFVENRNKGRAPTIGSLRELTYRHALVIGLFQLIAAVFPGTSRSGATIIGALMLGISRTVAAEFTFFLAIPVMAGASLLKLLKYGAAFSGTGVMLLAVGMVAAFLVSVAAIRFLMDYIKSHDFKVFGWYRIALGCLVLCYFTLCS